MNEAPRKPLKKSWKSRRAILLALALVSVTPLIVFALESWLINLRTTPEEWKVLAGVVPVFVGGGLLCFAAAAAVRWLCSWRNLRRLFLSLACVVTLALVFYSIENWRGWHAWNRYVHERVERCETLDLAALLPAAVPEDQNFCQCPLLKPIMNMKKVNGLVAWDDPKALARIQDMRPWLGSQSPWRDITNDLLGWQAYYRALLITNQPDDARSAIARRYGIRLQPQTNITVGSPTLPIPPALYLTNSPAEDVLLVLRRFEPDLAELKREAARRPLDRWAVHYDADSPLEVLLPHLGNVRGICFLLALRETALLAVGDPASALSDFQLGARLAESVRSEPLMISQMVRFACWEALLPPLQAGLRSHRLSDSQLADLQRELLSVDLLAGYELGVAGERACSGVWLTLTWKQCDAFSSGVDNEIRRPFYAMLRFKRVAPRGWAYQNQIEFCRLLDDYLTPCVDIDSRTVPPARTRALADAFQRAKGPYSVLVTLVFSLQARFSELYFRGDNLAHAQTQIDQAGIACALERYRLAQGQYPETLDVLVPQFIPKLPHDLIDGRPLHYRRTTDGDFRLYSVGWNEADDGGVSVLNDEGKPDLKKGDWVW